MITDHFGDLPPGALALGGIRHAPSIKPVILDRNHRCLVAPIFKQSPLPGVAPAQLIKVRRVINAKPRKDRHVMRTRQNIDTVDL